MAALVGICVHVQTDRHMFSRVLTLYSTINGRKSSTMTKRSHWRRSQVTWISLTLSLLDEEKQKETDRFSSDFTDTDEVTRQRLSARYSLPGRARWCIIVALLASCQDTRFLR